MAESLASKGAKAFLNGGRACHNGLAAVVARNKPHNGDIETSSLMTAQAHTGMRVSRQITNHQASKK